MEYMKRAAAHLANQGRGPDSTLMHVTDAEVHALGQLHPSGRLPRNPATGLPEAGFFDAILPMVVGAGTTIATGGNVALGSLAAGATKTAMTGDLKQGIMTGILSYGTGSALNSLAEPAAQAAGAAGNATANAAGSGLSNSASLAAANTSGDIAAQGAGGIGHNLASLPSSVPAVSAPVAAPAPPMSFMDKFANAPTQFSNKMDAIGQNLQDAPLATLKRTFLDNAMTTTLPIGASLVGSQNQEAGTKPQLTDAQLQKKYPEQFPTRSRALTMPGPDFIGGVSPEFNYFPSPNYAGGGAVQLGGPQTAFDGGGIAGVDPNMDMKANVAAEAKMALLDSHPRAKEALDRYAQVFGPEALEKLKGSVRMPGGRIRGAGGGLDDLVPGSIDGRQDVRLADGEFVVPADVVSHLGDGSTDQGARKLHEMMDRIRKNKTGTTKQAGSIPDNKVMPA